MNKHFKHLRDRLDSEAKVGVTSNDEVTDPYSSLEDSDFCVTSADEDIDDAMWDRMVRRPAPTKGRGY